jgi:undecaprenyl diphosphate synthase
VAHADQHPLPPATVPRHVAIVMDGNGRWAQQRGKPRHHGHRAGLDAARRAIESAAQRGIGTLTLFAFSSENWRRPESEVSFLMELFISALTREAKRLHRNNIRMRVIGDVSRFPEKLQQAIVRVEALTAGNQGMLLQVAANYGGRWDIVQAARQLAGQVASGSLQPEQIDESALAARLSFADVPDPDLFIRTGGEQRISNFMLWQCAYAELYFTETLWPDFGQDALDAALRDYARRERRFGQVLK